MGDINKSGQEAKALQRLLRDLTNKTKDYNTQRKEKTAALRPLLKQVWEALERRETVNGCEGKKAWAAWYNSGAKNPIRHIQKMIAEPKEGEANSVRVANCDKATHVIVGGVKYEITKVGVDHRGVIHIRVKEAAPPLKPKKGKKPLVHVHDEGCAISLCEKSVTKKHCISKRYKWAGEANCKACIKIANENGLPTVLTKEDVNPPTVHAVRNDIATSTLCGKGVEGKLTTKDNERVTGKACRRVIWLDEDRKRNRAVENAERFKQMYPAALELEGTLTQVSPDSSCD